MVAGSINSNSNVSKEISLNEFESKVSNKVKIKKSLYIVNK